MSYDNILGALLGTIRFAVENFLIPNIVFRTNILLEYDKD